MIKRNFIGLYEQSFQEYWDTPALKDYPTGEVFYYKDVANKIARLHKTFEAIDIKPGDKVALLARDSARWSIHFMAVITYGAVIVPILHDFSSEDAMTIIDHSDSKLLFVDEQIYQKLSMKKLPKLEIAMLLEDDSLLYSREEGVGNRLLEAEEAFDKMYPEGIKKEEVRYNKVPNETMILLNYTSGTTGYSKGVMVSANNLAGNVTFCMDKKIIQPGGRMICFLPMAHTYSCMTNLLLAMAQGAYVTILGRVPTPQILGQAFRQERPHVVVSVPLVLEKIYQSAIVPALKSPVVGTLLKLPFVNKLIHKKIRKQLLEGMGGEVYQFIVGGAALNPEVGAFLKKIGFPLTVGYGMTECAPLISYAYPYEWRLGSCGKVLAPIMEARIDAPKAGEPGEIQVRGENVCLGYYKNPELTEELFTPDGWMRTGDLALMDSDSFLYIKGRLKTMLLGSNGQNIYPEEIEAKIAMLPYVVESLVLMRSGKLVALILPDYERAAAAGLSRENLEHSLRKERQNVNQLLGGYEKIQSFEFVDKPFEKTPKQSIKRFLYQ